MARNDKKIPLWLKMERISFFRKQGKLCNLNSVKKRKLTGIKKALADIHQSKAFFSMF
ncbi:hypothetical protein [Pantoea rodasii]|uniref:hypothetical protein n=1 Tax=Pantoea rodasii TaxID=1076549 RepID=UPI0012E0C29F|nr:hypothetical protein [Pantoea rodasii]